MFVIVASHHSTHLPLPALRSAPRRSPESLSGDLDVRYILMNLNLVRICSHTAIAISFRCEGCTVQGGEKGLHHYQQPVICFGASSPLRIVDKRTEPPTAYPRLKTGSDAL